MIKFFINIRQKLLSENKFSKYLIYAIGEIILVVIGILIALQINNWNENKKERKTERKILTDLREEIQTNRNKITTSINRREKLLLPVNQHLKYLSEGKVTFISFKSLHDRSFWTGTVQPSFGVINSAISSGSINLIRSDSLKYMLTDWPDEVRDFVDYEEKAYVGHRLFNDYFDDKFPKNGNKYHNYNQKDLERRYKTIIKDVEYINRFLLIHNHLYAGVQIGNDLIKYLDEMTSLINHELELME